MMAGERWLVTGAARQLGGHLLRQLVREVHSSELLGVTRGRRPSRWMDRGWRSRFRGWCRGPIRTDVLAIGYTQQLSALDDLKGGEC